MLPIQPNPRKKAIAAWFQDRLALDSVREFIAHKTVPVHSGTIWYAFGGITLFLFVIQVVTGILLLVYYRPTPAEAYESVQFIVTRVAFGWLIRSIHIWSANLLILSAFVHMFSVAFMHAYRKPRELVWLSGIVLLALALGFGFSGYLATSDGDRDFTDLDHIAGLLQASTAGRRPTAAGLLVTLKQLESEAGGDPETDLTARQVESEAEAVRIMTVHAAKGLEFPIVCVPTLWRNSLAVAHEMVFQDPDTGLRTFDIANGEGWPTASDAKARKVRANDEARGENLRLLYVALTRAQHKTLVWWSRVQGCDITGLAHVLFARSNGAIDPELFAAPKVVLPPDSDAAAAPADAFSRAGVGVAVTVTGSADGPVHLWADGASRAPSRAIGLAVFDRVLVQIGRASCRGRV